MKLVIFGSTGGCGLAAMRDCLSAGHDVTVLVRSKDKLTQLFHQQNSQTNNNEEHKNNITNNDLPPNLSVVQGDIRDVDKVKEVIEGRDVIINGVGGVLSFSNPFSPSLTDPTICHDAISNIISAMSQVSNAPHRLIVVSTTGIDSTRDIPLAMIPLYHWLLHQPHADKKNMEQDIIDAGNKGIIKEWIIVRPALLTEGPLTKTYRAGSGIIGYTISRNDVGHFISQNVVSNEWVGKFPVLCS